MGRGQTEGNESRPAECSSPACNKQLWRHAVSISRLVRDLSLALLHVSALDDDHVVVVVVAAAAVRVVNCLHFSVRLLFSRLFICFFGFCLVLLLLLCRFCFCFVVFFFFCFVGFFFCWFGGFFILSFLPFLFLFFFFFFFVSLFFLYFRVFFLSAYFSSHHLLSILVNTLYHRLYLHTVPGSIWTVSLNRAGQSQKKTVSDESCPLYRWSSSSVTSMI